MYKKRVVYVIILVAVTLLSVVIAQRFLETPADETVSEEQRLWGSGSYNELVEYYLALLKQHPDSVTLHRSLIESYESIGENLQPSSVTEFYDSLEQSGNHPDICNYMKGYHFVRLGYNDSAIIYYMRVENDSLSYLQNSLGYAYAEMENDSLAAIHLLKAISYGENIPSATYHLSKLLFRTERYEELNRLVQDETLSQYVSLRMRRFIYLWNGNYFSYVKSFLTVKFSNLVPEGVVAGVLILLVWAGYLLRIDVFHIAKFRALWGVFILGALFSLLCTMFYDLYDIQFHFRLKGGYLNDLLFSVLGIGVVEESVKIIPVFLLLFITRSRLINEPLDYIVYGSFSALGFAFMENIGYFHLYGLNTIFARAQSASLLHMFLTALPLYGMVRAERAGSRPKWVGFLLYFGLAILVHGFYDFFLLGERGVAGLRALAPLILIGSIMIYKRMIQHMLNISEYYDLKRLNQLNHLSYYLGYSLFAVFILQFFILANRFGSEAAISSLPVAVYTALLPLFVIPSILGKFVICRGYLPSLLSMKQFVIPRELQHHYRNEWNSFLIKNRDKSVRISAGKRVWFAGVGAILGLGCYQVLSWFLFLQNPETVLSAGLGFLFVVLLLLVQVYLLRKTMHDGQLSLEFSFESEKAILRKADAVIESIPFDELFCFVRNLCGWRVKTKGKWYRICCRKGEPLLLEFAYHLSRFRSAEQSAREMEKIHMEEDSPKDKIVLEL